MSECGTRAGYMRHLRGENQACLPCTDANTREVKAFRVRTGRVRRLAISVDALRTAIETDSCKALLDFLGEEIAEAVLQSPKASRVAAT